MSVRRFSTFLLFWMLVAFATSASRAQQPACTTGNVQTSAGPVCGMSSPITIPGAGAFTANAYLGIPYAKAPLRWQNPVAPNSWTAPFPATRFGNECPQQMGVTVTNGVCSFNAPNQSEDCLYLNVWTPKGAMPPSKLPVLVFVHGGAFYKGTGGSSTMDLFDGTYLAASQNVVVVTFNYRLGVLGFLATSDMGEGAGNFGFRDQLMALNWVHQNIASFGGDPSQVLLFGQSAGAMSVGLHALSSSQSTGLFKAALMESNPLGLPYKTLEQARKVGDKFSTLLDCSNLKCLQQKSACELVAQEANSSLNPENPLLPTATLLSSVFHWTPVVDGNLITDQPMNNPGNLKVPMLMGTNQDEGILFANLLAQQLESITTPAGYAGSLGVVFGLDAVKVLKNNRYSCSVAPCTPQLANMITDYIFTCANRRLAMSAGSAQDLYMYLFDQASSFNPVPGMSACQGQVCHGAELVYVFNTAWAVPLQRTFKPAEEALSQTMGAAWANFAKSHSPDGAWPLFLPNKTYLKLDEKSSAANDPLDTTANCTSLWDTIGYQSSAIWVRLLADLKDRQQKPVH